MQFVQPVLCRNPRLVWSILPLYRRDEGSKLLRGEVGFFIGRSDSVHGVRSLCVVSACSLGCTSLSVIRPESPSGIYCA